MAVNDILEVLAQSHVQRLQIDFALHDFQQTVELIDRQVLNDGLRHGSDLLLRGRARQCLIDKVGVDLLERGVSAIDEIAQVFNTRRLILNQDEDEMEGQRGQGLPVSCLVDRTDVWDTLLRKSALASAEVRAVKMPSLQL